MVVVPVVMIMVMMEVVVVMMIVIVVMMVIVVVTMVMIMMVVMVVITLHRLPHLAVGIELLKADLLLLRLRELHDEVDDLVLEDGSADLGQHLRIIPVEIVDLALLAGELTGPLEQRAVDLI